MPIMASHRPLPAGTGSWASCENSRVTRMAPDAPKGWPRAMAPPTSSVGSDQG
jgi:hypothetical protein